MSKETTPNHKQPMSPRRKNILVALAVFFLLLGLLYGIYWLIWGRFRESTEDAYVSGNQVQLMSQISGTVTAIYTDDTEHVQEGQPLVKLDDADTFIALDKARANLAVTVRQVRQYYEKVQQLRALLVVRGANLLQIKQDLNRRIGLVSSGALSKEELTHYRNSVETAQAQYSATTHELTSSLSLVENSTLYQHPLVEQAKNQFRSAYLNWVRTIVYAPVTGYVAKRSVQVGQQISTGTPLLAVVPLNQVWVDANYKENQLSRLRIGQRVTLKADANSVTYHGHIQGLTPGTGSAFAILPPQNASGNWIKIVQRLAVRISLDPKEVSRHPLQIGLSMRVTAHTHQLKGQLLSSQNLIRPLYSTWIFNNQLDDANRQIDHILRANAPENEHG